MKPAARPRDVTAAAVASSPRKQFVHPTNLILLNQLVVVIPLIVSYLITTTPVIE